ncbi:MAG: hypothetical protein ACHQ4J_05870 [Candidatus Binatia bacterium]
MTTTGAPTDIWFVGGVTVSGTGCIVMNNALFLNNRMSVTNQGSCKP